MVDAIVSGLATRMTSFIVQEMREEVRLVVGVDNEGGKLTNNLRAIQAVLVDAERRQVKEETVRLWLDELKYTSYDMEDVLDEWNTARLKLQIEGVDENALAPRKVCSFFSAPCFGFKQVFLRRDIALKIKEINKKLDNVAKQKDSFNFNVNVMKTETPKLEPTVSLIDESEIIGRVQEKNTLISKLLCESCSEQKGHHIISLVGMGGIGKTTLAQLAYNNADVKRTFHERIWVCVSDPFDQVRIAAAIIEAIEGSSCNLVEFQSLINHIQEIITGKRFLLCLDDVWTEDYNKWEPFYNCLKNGLHGSKILITTRKGNVARVMRSTDIISVDKLTEEECWSSFKGLAFFGRSNEECEKLEQIGRNIVGKCKGLPLAAKTIGSLLLSKDTEEEWQYVLDSETWEQKELEKGLFVPLLLSYNDLPSAVKRCFSYCAIFPKDHNMCKDELIKLWMAQGYLGVKTSEEIEIIGDEYFRILSTRSFFQEFEKDGDDNIMWCKMHDIVHDFAQFVSKGECFTVDVTNDLEESLLNSFHTKVCHSMLTFGEEVPFPVSICRFQRLRTLLIENNRMDYTSISNVLEELFSELTCLRVLDLSYSVLKFSEFQLLGEIPTNIEKLVHLRYINLSGQDIINLPETLCELYNLQILDVSGCGKLQELPQGIGELRNMRYLLNDYTDSLRLMPVGIARLTNLRRITKFVHHGQGCTFESLKNLVLLRECRMERLGNVSDVGVVNRSELDKKKNLLVLALKFDRDGEGERRNEEDEQLLEALQPPLIIKKLEIWNYRGSSIFTEWMLSLTNMRVLRLHECENCVHFPPLGELPSLEKLYVWSMVSLKEVGDEFLGAGTSSSSSTIISFPKLKSLELFQMEEWEEWDYGIERRGEIMPRLSTLKIMVCPKLKALPDYLLRKTTLQILQIGGCPILSERYRKETGEVGQRYLTFPIPQFNKKTWKGVLDEFFTTTQRGCLD